MHYTIYGGPRNFSTWHSLCSVFITIARTRRLWTKLEQAIRVLHTLGAWQWSSVSLLCPRPPSYHAFGLPSWSADFPPLLNSRAPALRWPMSFSWLEQPHLLFHMAHRRPKSGRRLRHDPAAPCPILVASWVLVPNWVASRYGSWHASAGLISHLQPGCVASRRSIPAHWA